MDIHHYDKTYLCTKIQSLYRIKYKCNGHSPVQTYAQNEE